MLEVNSRRSSVWHFIKQVLEGALCTWLLLCAEVTSVGILWWQLSGTESYPPALVHLCTSTLHFSSLKQIENSISKIPFWVYLSTVPSASFASFEAVCRKCTCSAFGNWSMEEKKITCLSLFDFLIWEAEIS